MYTLLDISEVMTEVAKMKPKLVIIITTGSQSLHMGGGVRRNTDLQELIELVSWMLIIAATETEILEVTQRNLYIIFVKHWLLYHPVSLHPPKCYHPSKYYWWNKSKYYWWNKTFFAFSKRRRGTYTTYKWYLAPSQ